ncbi:hypothetical protein OG723_01045 [Streptomyces sp. NBC_01278]
MAGLLISSKGTSRSRRSESCRRGGFLNVRRQQSRNPFAFAFDVLQQDGQGLLTHSYTDRRTLLEGLCSEYALTTPPALCPMTTDLAKARQWLKSWTDVSGVAGLVAQPAVSLYRGGQRLWEKVRHSETVDAEVTGFTGTPARPPPPCCPAP